MSSNMTQPCETRIMPVTHKVKEIMKKLCFIVSPCVTTEVEKQKHDNESSKTRSNSNINIDLPTIAKNRPPNLFTTK